MAFLASLPVAAGEPIHSLCLQEEGVFPPDGTPSFILPLKGEDIPGAGFARGPVGFALLRHIAGEAEILTLCVLPECRRAGIAGALVGAIKTWAAEQEITSVFLEVNEHNAAAVQLYKNNGFAVIAQRREYYQNEDGSHEHALVMRLTVK